jgi:hypothetical protein
LKRLTIILPPTGGATKATLPSTPHHPTGGKHCCAPYLPDHLKVPGTAKPRPQAILLNEAENWRDRCSRFPTFMTPPIINGMKLQLVILLGGVRSAPEDQQGLKQNAMWDSALCLVFMSQADHESPIGLLRHGDLVNGIQMGKQGNSEGNDSLSGKLQ